MCTSTFIHEILAIVPVPLAAADEFVVGKRVVDIKEIRELSPDIDIGSSDSQNKAQEVNTPHLCGLHRFCVQRVSTCTHVLYVPIM